MLRNYLLTNSGTAVHLMTLLSWSIKLRILFFSKIKSQSSHFCPIFLQETEEMEKMELIQPPLAPCSVSDQIHLLINSHHFYNVKEILLDIVTVSFEVEKNGLVSGNAWFLLFSFNFLLFFFFLRKDYWWQVGSSEKPCPVAMSMAFLAKNWLE